MPPLATRNRRRIESARKDLCLARDWLAEAAKNVKLFEAGIAHERVCEAINKLDLIEL